MNITEATIIDSLNGKPLGQISLQGKPVRADELLSSSGNVQGYTISSGMEHLWDAWFDQKAITLRIGDIQQKAKIITYPTDGETDGYLDWIKGTRERFVEDRRFRPVFQARKGLALLQALLGA